MSDPQPIGEGNFFRRIRNDPRETVHGWNAAAIRTGHLATPSTCGYDLLNTQP
jgi:hypothetical protein